MNSGKTKVLLTRSREGNEQLAPMVASAGFEPLVADVLELIPARDWAPVDDRLLALDGYDWVVITSPTGAELFCERTRGLKVGPGRVSAKIAAIGPKTAAALAEGGWRASFVPSRSLTLSLAEELPGTGRALLLRSDLGNRSLAEVLRERGFEVDEVTLYTTRRRELGFPEAVTEADIVIFGSPSAVEALCSQLPEGALAELVEKRAACIGPVTAEAARARGFTRIISPATEHTFDSLLEEIARAQTVA